MLLQHSEVRYEVTDHCNAHCLMCPREKHDRQHGIMDQSNYERSIREITELGAKQVVLTGFGEPLLDKNLESKITYAKSNGLRTYIITNASALTEQRSRGLLDAGLDEIRISFYGMNPDSYNKVMRGLDFHKTLDAVNNFISINDKCTIQISYLVLEENESDVSKFIEYWEPKVTYIEVWKPHNWSNGRQYREITSNKRTCGRPEHGPLQIQWNGDVIPCCYDYNNSMVLGNAFTTPILDILHGKEYEALRDAHRNNEFHKYPFCDGCDQLIDHPDVLLFTNRHTLQKEEAVNLSNTDLSRLR